MHHHQPATTATATIPMRTNTTATTAPHDARPFLGPAAAGDAPTDMLRIIAKRDLCAATRPLQPVTGGHEPGPIDGARYKRTRQDHGADDEQAQPRQEAKRLRSACAALPKDPHTVTLDAMPPETMRAIIDLIDDRDLHACLLASPCFHVYSRAEMLARRYALDSGRDIFDSDEPVADIIGLCKRQRRRSRSG
ncbi:ankyrin repeat protein [Pandoravirus inopinatum]|uniref:Ankyrin repeat protein n=1 Tax=Pandoravirus inopinatum TaxID=1605721 RepID=A0A0B5IW51_9VIRU|nr:ankyrin repeat protein [Pandoravirus inopinatum]AJF96908.1 ankyrin repeat protein [Pandoravirus inopinatum]